MNTRLAVLALATAALAACEPNPSVTGPAAAPQAARAADVSAALSNPGAVYTLTNQVGGNAVAVFARGADGRLTAAGTVSTGGTGTGASLGSQSAVTLSEDGRWLFAVNAGSNDVSVFSVSPGGGLALASRTASGGTLPISLTVHGNVLYVLNAGGTGNISGLALGTSGALTAIAGATRPLSGSNVGPAQVSFSPDGRRLGVGLRDRAGRGDRPGRCERRHRVDRRRHQRHRAEPRQPVPVRAADRRRTSDPRVPRTSGRAPHAPRGDRRAPEWDPGP